MKDLTVFVLTHNRGDLLLETIDSVLNQTCHDFKFIVSDNSSNDETMKMLEERKYLDKFEYRKRDREYSSFEHFNLCMNEVNTKYFILFHDDDLMIENFVETMYSSIFNEKYIAVGCNSFILQKTEKTKNIYLKTKKNILINNEYELVQQYLCDNIVPYPSYIYNTEKIRENNILYENTVGKYSDVAWLLTLLKFGSIYWLKKEFMYYRVHRNQDSNKIDFYNQLKLFKLYKKYSTNKYLRKLLMKKHIKFLYNYESSTKKSYRNWRIYYKYSRFELFPKIIIKKLLRIYK